MVRKSKSTKPWNVSNLEFSYNQRKLWLNPQYQRTSVWTKYQKQLFIDSLFRDIDIPKLYFRETNKKGYEYEVVDGQQRLRAIFEYLKSEYKMPSDADIVDGKKIKDFKFNELHLDLQMKLRNVSLDVVIFNSSFTDDDIEEMFLRLQNGTPLNAAEKRKAISGKMKTVVHSLARHKVFDLCSFSDKRYAYEDAVAKALHLLLTGFITDIRPLSIKRTYEQNRNITASNPTVKKAKNAFNFIVKSFQKGPSPKLKKFSLISLTFLCNELLEKYNLREYQKQFGKAYIKFELDRRKNEELPEDKQDPSLAAYTDAARSDSIQDMTYRHEVLRKMVIRAISELILKDPDRGFSEEQREAVYWRDKGKCKICGKKCDETDYHVDHIKAYAKGGQTKISNAQLLCPKCNLQKGKK